MSDNPYQQDLDDIRFGYIEDTDDCDHSEYDIDFEGRVECVCGKRWFLTPAQEVAYREAEAAYEAEMEAEYRLERRWSTRIWRWLQRWVFVAPFGKAQGPFDPAIYDFDDEIPF